jgi:hypothetical protein
MCGCANVQIIAYPFAFKVVDETTNLHIEICT